MTNGPDTPERDPALARAWQAHSQETPPPELDRRILAAAHRAVGSAPEDAAARAAATRPQRWWMPLAAAATIGVVVIGMLQVAPLDQEAMAPVAEIAPPTRGPAPNLADESKARTNTSGPVERAESARQEAALAEKRAVPGAADARTATSLRGKLQGERAPASPSPRLEAAPAQDANRAASAALPPTAASETRADAMAPPAVAPKRRATSVQANTAPASVESKESGPSAAPTIPSPPRSAPAMPPQPAPEPFPAAPASSDAANAGRMAPNETTASTRGAAAMRKDAPRQARRSAATREGDAAPMAAPARPAPMAAPAPAAPMARAAVPAPLASEATSPEALRAKARDPEAWIARIRKLRDDGNVAEAQSELRDFRAAFTDAEQRLPPDLRDWMKP